MLSTVEYALLLYAVCPFLRCFDLFCTLAIVEATPRTPRSRQHFCFVLHPHSAVYTRHAMRCDVLVRGLLLSPLLTLQVTAVGAEDYNPR